MHSTCKSGELDVKSRFIHPHHMNISPLEQFIIWISILVISIDEVT